MTQANVEITRVYEKAGRLLIKPFTAFRGLKTDGQSPDSAENELAVGLAFLVVLAGGLFLHVALSGIGLVLVFVWAWMIAWMLCFFCYCTAGSTFYHLKSTTRKDRT